MSSRSGRGARWTGRLLKTGQVVCRRRQRIVGGDDDDRAFLEPIREVVVARGHVVKRANAIERNQTAVKIRLGCIQQHTIARIVFDRAHIVGVSLRERLVRVAVGVRLADERKSQSILHGLEQRFNICLIVVCERHWKPNDELFTIEYLLKTRIGRTNAAIDVGALNLTDVRSVGTRSAVAVVVAVARVRVEADPLHVHERRLPCAQRRRHERVLETRKHLLKFQQKKTMIHNKHKY